MITKVSDPNFDQNGIPWSMGHGGNGCRGIPTVSTTPQIPMQLGDGTNALASFWGAMLYAMFPYWIAGSYLKNAWVIEVDTVDSILYLFGANRGTADEPITNYTVSGPGRDATKSWTRYSSFPESYKIVWDIITGNDPGT